MAGPIWVVGEAAPDGRLARISGEVATLARQLGDASAREVAGVVVGPAGAGAADTAGALADFVPRVLLVDEPAVAEHAAAALIAARVAALVEREQPSYLLLGATPDGRDVAGMLAALLGWGVLVNATEVGWAESGPTVGMSIFGGRLLTTSAFTADHGILTIRPNTATASTWGTRGRVEPVEAGGDGVALPRVRVVERVEEAGAAAAIEEARVIVAGGRGVGSPEGFGIVQQLADALGGVVGATRAAVDAGWIPYSHQIGQTGKIVKPQLYMALGISGAIQHKVGMQTAETIVAVNRDADAPVAEFADLLVVGDLFEVVPELVSQLRARTG
ncbi:MAG: electron transfer flavoprotein subunit alpha/FixB family protein [Candidatus Limnocylindrales bacterium]